MKGVFFMPYMYDLKLDFHNDWENFLKMKLEESGYEVKEEKQEISYKYFNLCQRLIEATPRKVLISKEFTVPKEYEEIIQLIIKKVEKGEDINSYLSTRILDIDYNDGLLNDWGIYHLHLGDALKRLKERKSGKKGTFIKRTGPLLFARFDRNNAYFINIMQHNDWSKRGIVKIIHDNWPESIERYLLNGITAVMPGFDDKAHGELRNSGVNLLVQVEEGIVYAPLGGGISSDGGSTAARITSDQYTRKVRNIEDIVKEHYIKYARVWEKRGINLNGKLHFHLQFVDYIDVGVTEKVRIHLPKFSVYAVEINSGQAVSFGDL